MMTDSGRHRGFFQSWRCWISTTGILKRTTRTSQREPNSLEYMIHPRPPLPDVARVVTATPLLGDTGRVPSDLHATRVAAAGSLNPARQRRAGSLCVAGPCRVRSPPRWRGPGHFLPPSRFDAAIGHLTWVSAQPTTPSRAAELLLIRLIASKQSMRVSGARPLACRR